MCGSYIFGLIFSNQKEHESTHFLNIHNLKMHIYSVADGFNEEARQEK